MLSEDSVPLIRKDSSLNFDGVANFLINAQSTGEVPKPHVRLGLIRRSWQLTAGQIGSADYFQPAIRDFASVAASLYFGIHFARDILCHGATMKRYERFSAAGILLAAVMFSSQQAAAQVLRIAEMNTQQIRALNLQKTVVLIPGGILEEHGPYLPS
jgi:hypothetical protein